MDSIVPVNWFCLLMSLFNVTNKWWPIFHILTRNKLFSGSYFSLCLVQVLDEGLRATSGFQGTDDLLECRLSDIQLLSDNRRAKRVSSAPLYESSMPGILKNDLSGNPSGAKQWREVIEKHLPLVLSHGSSMVGVFLSHLFYCVKYPDYTHCHLRIVFLVE